MDASRRAFLAALATWWRARRVPATGYLIVLPSKPCPVPTLAQWKAVEARMPEIRRKLDELEVAQYNFGV